MVDDGSDAYNPAVLKGLRCRVIPRHLKLFVLLLPLFIARSMLPIGFMVSFDEGMPRIVFCPSQISVPAQATSDDPHAMHLAQGHEHHHQTTHHHEGAGDSIGAEQSHQSCPFAFAAAAPFASALAFSADPPASEAIAALPDSTISLLASRAHPIRGPPVLS